MPPIMMAMKAMATHHSQPILRVGAILHLKPLTMKTASVQSRSLLKPLIPWSQEVSCRYCGVSKGM